MMAFTLNASSRFLLIFVAAFLFHSNAAAQIAKIPIPAAPQVSANSYLVMDADTGFVVASDNPDKRVAPASLTKLMSAYVIFQYLKAEQISLDETVTVSNKAYKTPGSRMFIEENSKVSIEDLIQGMIVQSGNDASVAMAEHLAGTEGAFADLMNNFAAELGMASTNFQNATGLPADNHYTTARDIAVLARAIVNEFPEYYAWYSQREFTYAGIRQENRNKLLKRDSSVDGMKTGHTDAAGYCLVSSAKRSGMRLIVAMMGSRSPKARVDASQALLNYGFRFYETKVVYERGAVIKTADIWKGQADQLSIGTDQRVSLTLPRGRFEELQASIEIPSTLIAPIDSGQVLGQLKIEHDGKILSQVRLVALANVAKGGLWKRMTDEVSLWFE